jgi:UDP-N-acetylmuramoyl-tripeptide--D-alanyl-D-alanine ligase
MELMFKAAIKKKLEGYVKKYFKRHPEVKLVVVVGSVGKTTTKIAIATVLSERFRVRLHEGNHNSELSAPLALLGIRFPDNIRNTREWREVFKAAKKRINEPSDVDVIVQELGTDRVGQIPHFGTYLKPDLAVVTSVSPEHMEFFKTLDAVAAEELSAANFSERALINRDDIDGVYAADLMNANINTYGTTDAAEYHFIQEDFSLNDGFKGNFIAPEWDIPVETNVKLMGESGLRAAIAAGAVGLKLGLNSDEVRKGMNKITPVSGRMNLLRGLNKSVIIDDTYNSSPLAAEAALRTLYALTAPQKIVVLGNMNELGGLSSGAHEEVGKLCDSSQLAHVVTVGEDAERYLAPAALANGCHVVSFKSPLEAGAFVHKVMEPGALILFKGSQGNVYLEEAVKIVLHSTEEESKLVRQSPQWMAIKQKFFDGLSN